MSSGVIYPKILEVCHFDAFISNCIHYLPCVGTKCVIRQNIDSAECTFKRFQPFTFSTEGYSDCIYSKSSCDYEGLVNHNNGSTTDDRNCRCDYNNGYAFVLKPRKNYFCVPSQEDCSCYQHSCEESFKLSAGKYFTYMYQIDF